MWVSRRSRAVHSRGLSEVAGFLAKSKMGQSFDVFRAGDILELNVKASKFGIARSSIVTRRIRHEDFESDLKCDL